MKNIVDIQGCFIFCTVDITDTVSFKRDETVAVILQKNSPGLITFSKILLNITMILNTQVDLMSEVNTT